MELLNGQKLLAEICDLAAVAGEKLGDAGKALALAMAEGAALDGLFADLLVDKGRIQALGEEKGVSADMLSLLLYLAIRPSIEKGAQKLAEHL